MAKMFYTLEETAAKLAKSAEEVRGMAQSGQLQEFRDRDKLVFKKEQVDLLSGGGDEEPISLADSGGEIPLASDESGSGAPAATPPTKERSGISIFEADEGEDDPMAQTQITAGVGGGFGGDAGSSGSGLLGMTQEADDTSLGAGLLDDVYGGKGAPAGGADAGPSGGFGDAGGDAPGGGGALFESAGMAEAGMVAAPALMAAEAYDGAGSGLVGGLALGMVLISGLLIFTTVLGLMGVPGAGLVSLFASNLWMYVGIFAGAVLVFGALGWFLGRKS